MTEAARVLRQNHDKQKEFFEQARVLRAREGLLNFTKYVKPDYQVNWHHKLLCQKLNQFAKGEVKRLMIFLPPRHGKSELVSRKLPAFILGIKPTASIIATSYGASLASSMNRDVQRIIDSPQYRAVFPDTILNGENVRTVQTQWLRNSDLFEVVNWGGVYRCAGVGGSITGVGGEFCFASGTKILTISGNRDIEDLRVGDVVWSYNHATRKTELKKIQAVARRYVSEVVQVTTTKGSSLLCTPEHPFWTEKFGYREAGSLSQGEILFRIPEAQKIRSLSFVCFLQKALHAPALRVRKSIAEKYERLLLFAGLFPRTSQCKKHDSRNKNMRDLFGYFSNVSTTSAGGRLLFQTVFRGLQKSENAAGFTSVVSSRFLSFAGANYRAGRGAVCALQEDGKTHHASHRPRQKQQQYFEPCDAVSAMSHCAPLVRRDTVSLVKRLRCGEVQVHDIQVEGNHNFFAEGVLVHNCIIDDPIKNQEEADSPVYRDKVWDWYTSTLYTRLERDGAILLTQTRWHDDDLAGRLLQLQKSDPAADQWEVLSFPAMKENDKDPLDPREVGEALWPGKYSATRLAGLKASVGSRVWTSLYQQNPTAVEGTIVKHSYLVRRWKALPAKFDVVVQSWDLAFKDSKGSDFVVGQVWGKLGAEFYLVDQFRARIPFTATIQAIKDMTSKHPKALLKLVEDKANGPAVISSLHKEIPGLVAIEPEGSKESRLNAVSPLFEAGNVILPDASMASWVKDYVDELCGFPRAAKDDQVDATTQALLRLWDGAGEFTEKYIPPENSTQAYFPRNEDSW